MTRNAKGSRPNKYRAQCDRCADYVPATAGILVGRRKGRWMARHIECNSEGTRQVGPPIMSTGHNVGPACGLTGVQLDPAVGDLEGRNLDKRIRELDRQREADRLSRDLAADEDEHARNLQMRAGF